MNRRYSPFLLPLFYIFLLHSSPAAAQSQKPAVSYGALTYELEQLVNTPAVSGYENQLADKIRTNLRALHPATDNLGDVTITIGSGAPHRLIVTPIDEPGFVVSEITPDGYLRVQRLPQNGLPPIFNEMYAAQPLRIEMSAGKRINGVVAGLSVHLHPGRANPPKASDIENIYVDIGATSAAEVRKAGVDILNPIVINRRLMNLAAAELAGASIGDRFGAAALVELLGHVDPTKIKGTLTVAFVVQQRTGACGLQRILTRTQADELIYVGRLLPGGPIPEMETMHRAPRREPGGGVLVGVPQTDGSLPAFATELKQLADANKIPFASDYSASILPKSYLPMPQLPAKWAHLAIATSWTDTPAETIDSSDLLNLTSLLNIYLGAAALTPSGGSKTRDARSGFTVHAPLPNMEVLRDLVEAYGVSYHEARVRASVERLLPPWAKPE